MRDKTVTVFGGTGFIGRYVVEKLAHAGAYIRVPSRRIDRALFLKPLGDIGQIVPEARDVSDPKDVRAAIQGSDAVVNLVGILYESKRGDFLRLQAELPGHIGVAARDLGLQSVVHVSAIGADPNSSAVYARTKGEGEQALRDAFPEAVILRPSVLFGPEDEFFNRFAAMARLAPALPLVGGGTTKFQPVYVGDVAAAVMAGLSRPEARGKIYELGGPKVASFAELLRYMLSITGQKRFLAPLPFGLAKLQARFLELLPKPMLTRDQVELLKTDNVVGDNALTLNDLGIDPTPMDLIVPQYLRRFMPPKARAAVERKA